MFSERNMPRISPTRKFLVRIFLVCIAGSLTRSAEKQSENWTSHVYAHFNAPMIVKEKGVKKYRFICKRYVGVLYGARNGLNAPFTSRPSNHITRARYDTSTKNLGSHVKSCSPTTDSKQAITRYTNGGSYDKGAFRFYTVRWVTTKCRPFVIIEDEDLLMMFKTLNPNVETVSDTTVSRDVHDTFDLAFPQVVSKLEVSYQCST
jgi:hypothetical protein